MRNTSMLRAFVAAKVSKTADKKFVGRLVNSLQRATAPRPKSQRRK